MTFPKLPFAYVSWLDAHSPAATAVYDLASIAEIHGSLPIVTSGWVLKHDDEGISVASEYCGSEDFRGITHVPAKMIVEVVVVRPPRAKKKRPPKEPLITP